MSLTEKCVLAAIERAAPLPRKRGRSTDAEEQRLLKHTSSNFDGIIQQRVEIVPGLEISA
jgi:hypothetical protein